MNNFNTSVFTLFIFACFLNILHAEIHVDNTDQRYALIEPLCYEFSGKPNFDLPSERFNYEVSLLPDKDMKHKVSFNCETFQNRVKSGVGFVQKNKNGAVSIKNQFVTTPLTLEEIKKILIIGDEYKKVKNLLVGFVLGQNWGIMSHEWHLWVKDNGTGQFYPVIVRGYFQDVNKTKNIHQWILIKACIWTGTLKVTGKK